MFQRRAHIERVRTVRREATSHARVIINDGGRPYRRQWRSIVIERALQGIVCRQRPVAPRCPQHVQRHLYLRYKLIPQLEWAVRRYGDKTRNEVMLCRFYRRFSCVDSVIMQLDELDFCALRLDYFLDCARAFIIQNM